MSSQADIEAFILIGGRSTRFGRDKAFYEFENEPLAARAARIAETALGSNTATFVAASQQQFGPTLLLGLGRSVVADLRPGCGAWSALHTALTYARSEWVLVLACDLPFVTVEFLRLLARHANSDCDAIVPRQTDGRLQPLCALYRSDPALARVDKLLDQGATLPPLTAIFDDLRTCVIGPQEYLGLENGDKLLANINTPDNLAL